MAEPSRSITLLSWLDWIFVNPFRVLAQWLSQLWNKKSTKKPTNILPAMPEKTLLIRIESQEIEKITLELEGESTLAVSDILKQYGTKTGNIGGQLIFAGRILKPEQSLNELKVLAKSFYGDEFLLPMIYAPRLSPKPKPSPAPSIGLCTDAPSSLKTAQEEVLIQKIRKAKAENAPQAEVQTLVNSLKAMQHLRDETTIEPHTISTFKRPKGG